MKDELRRVLDPGDDGRAFTDAVLLRASGALYRRRRAADVQAGALDWLAAWARPWLVTAVLALACAAAVLPLLPGGGANASAVTAEPAEAAMLAAPQPEDMLVVTIGNGSR
jgi:hypothetical protein